MSSDPTLMQMQHEIYGEMIAYMFGSARRRYQEAAMLLDVKTDLSESLIDQYSVDHRTLQRAHDLIAAYYRFKHDDGGQLQLNENAEAYRLRLRNSSREFFQAEVDHLLQYAEFTRAIVTAGICHDQKRSNRATDRLCLFLEDRYSEMEWSGSPEIIEHHAEE